MGERARTDLKPLMFSGGVDTEVEPNEYDKVRKAVPFRDSRSLPIGARTLSTEMSCPICLDLLSQTMTAKECLHRFCSECITMALQRGNKECPTCRKKLVSKRSLRPDPAFDLLIQKVWPDRSIYENLQQHEHNLAREESPDEDDSPTEVNEDGVPQPKKKKTSAYDPESLMEYFLAQQQSRRQKAEEEEYPELNGEQAFLEREAIDNLLDNGTMHEYEDFNEDDDVYGDELELDEAGNVIESSHKNNNNGDGDVMDESLDDTGESGEYDPYAYSEENEEDFDDYEGFDSMAALTPEQQEELQADLEELEAIEYEVYELDFSDEEVEEEGDQLPDNVEEVNGMRYRSSDNSSDEEEAAAAKKAVVEETIGTSDSSSSSSSSDSSEDKEEENIDRDATPPAYAPEMNLKKKEAKIDEPVKTDTLEKTKMDSMETKNESTSLLPIGHPLPSQPSPIINTILPPRPSASEPSLYSSGVPLPSAADVGEMPRVEFTPPPEDDDSPPGPIFDVANAPLNTVIAIAPSSTNFGGMLIKEERLSPTPPDATAASNEITIIEEEDDDSSDSTSTTYSSSGHTSTLSTVSSVISMEFSEGDDEEVAAINNGVEMITEGDFQMPSSSNAVSTNSSSYQPSSTSIKPAATSLTVYSEDLPPHREDDPVTDEVIPDEHRPPSSTIPPSDRLNHWLATNPCSPISVEEDMTEMPQRRVDDCDISETVSGSEEIEAELLPASSLLQRDCPDELLVPRYVRAKHDTKMAHLAEFIHERALEELQANQKDFDADPVPTLPKPIHFYVFSRNEGHHVKQIFLHETMATALCAMTQGDHLIIFYDIAGIDLRGEKPGSLLADVVPSHFLSLPPVYL